MVRASLRAPQPGYLVTAGVLNLADEPGATSASERIKTMLDNGSGRLAGMSAGAGTEPLETGPAQFGWRSRGHFLAYCLVVRSDGQPVSSADLAARRILYELVELHLRQAVLGSRATAVR